jgi:hypothetical protein
VGAPWKPGLQRQPRAASSSDESALSEPSAWQPPLGPHICMCRSSQGTHADPPRKRQPRGQASAVCAAAPAKADAHVADDADGAVASAWPAVAASLLIPQLATYWPTGHSVHLVCWAAACHPGLHHKHSDWLDTVGSAAMPAGQILPGSYSLVSPSAFFFVHDAEEGSWMQSQHSVKKHSGQWANASHCSLGWVAACSRHLARQLCGVSNDPDWPSTHVPSQMVPSLTNHVSEFSLTIRRWTLCWL